MFAPMTSGLETIRFEAETQELQRRAAQLMQVQMTPSVSLLNSFAQRFTAWALRRHQPVEPATACEQAPNCC
ncbi:MAG TPA: hypothetical protein VER79_13505 [Candidatus Limnocylindrales bacterium]|nr:hypothetical protein [Candidatus Limnocylindrales bacterium]